MRTAGELLVIAARAETEITMDNLADVAQPLAGGGAEAPVPLTNGRAWREWPPEKLWLWSDPTQPAVRARIRAALADAVSKLATDHIERIAQLAEENDPASALRLTARLLRTTGEGQRARDLAGCALLLAVIEHRDERAALELVVLIALRTAGTRGPWPYEYTYPAPLDRPRRVRARLMQRGTLAVLLLADRTGWARAVRDLGQMAAGDPLCDVGTNGRQVSGWDRR